MPNLIGGIVLGYIWQILINCLLTIIGQPLLALNSSAGYWGLIILMCWQQIGYMMIIYIAGLQSIPGDVIEAAQIDGASDWLILRRIAIPLIKPTLAVVTMYYAIGHWNDFMTPLIYINKESLQPMQLLLRRILAQFSTDFTQGMNIMAALKSVVSVQIRYVTIVVAIAPILLVYPFIQKYFVKGITIGAVKG
mgnify:CR=1 FL=1